MTQYSYVEYAGDGATTEFNFGFSYIQEEDVLVTVDGVAVVREVSTTPVQKVILSAAPAAETVVRVYRSTEIDESIVDYTTSTTVRKADLNAQATQGIYLNQETRDIAEEAITDAEDATAIAEEALTKAEAAVVTADAAEATANAAVVTADAAEATANAADAKADAAVITADAADAKADAAVVTANDADIKADLAILRAPPPGGTAGQLLAKKTDADGDDHWIDVPGGGDMLRGIYDPTNVGSDAFDADNTAVDTVGTMAQTNVQDALVGLSNSKVDATTGWLRAPSLSINSGDNTLFDISEGYGFIVDRTVNTIHPVMYEISFPGATGISPVYLNQGIPSTEVLIDNTGAILQQSTAPTPEQQRLYLHVGSIIHPTNTVVEDVQDLPIQTWDTVGGLDDLNNALGTLNKYGNVFYGHSSNDLQFAKTSGEYHRAKAGSTVNTPNDEPSPALEPVTDYLRGYRDGAGGWTYDPQSLITPGVFDDNSGSPSSVSPNDYTIQRIYNFPGTNNVVVLLGQQGYNTIEEARVGVNDPTEVPVGLATASLRCLLIVKNNATNLNDTATAQFICTGILGEVGGIGGAATSIAELTKTVILDGTESTQEFDWSLGTLYTLNASQDYILSNPTNVVPGFKWLRVIQDGTGSRTITWGNRYVFEGGVTPVLSTDPYKTDLFIFDTWNDGTIYVKFRKGYEFPAVPRLSVSTNYLAASAAVGFDPHVNTATFDITNTGTDILNWSLTDTEAWMSLDITSGSLSAGASETITVTYSTSTLPIGTYGGTIDIISSNGDNSPQVINVDLQITAVPFSTIGTDVSSLTQEVFEGNDAGSQSITLSNTGGYPSIMAYSIATDAAWVSAVPSSGSVNAGDSTVIAINYDTDALTEGTYNANITITAADCTNSPVVIPVELEVSSGFSNITVGSDAVLDGTSSYHSITRMTDNLFIWCFYRGSNGGAYLYEVSGNTITYLDAATFNSLQSTSYISVTRLTDTTAVVCYRDDGNINYGTACVLTISGNTLSAGGEYVFEAAGCNYISVCRLTDSAALVCYQSFAIGNGVGRSKVLTISGTTITGGISTDYQNTETSYNSVVPLDSTKAVVCYYNYSTANEGTAVILTLSGTTITAGAPVVFNAASTGYISVAAISPSKAIVSFKDDGNSGYCTSCVLSINDTTITKGTGFVIDASTSQSMSSCAIADNQILVTYRAASSFGTGAILTIDGTDITVASSLTVYNSGGTLYNSVDIIDSNTAVVAYQDGGNSSYGTATPILLS